MTPKIKELAKQAGFELWGDEPWKPVYEDVDWSSSYDKELTNLVELVVKMCADKAGDLGSHFYCHKDYDGADICNAIRDDILGVLK